MSPSPLYIHNFCIIRNHTVVTREGVVFQNNETSGDDFLNAVYNWLNPAYPKFYKMDRLSKLGFLASEVVLKGRSLKTEYPPEAVAVVLSNANSSLDTDIRYWESTKTVASPALFVYTLPNIVSGEICIRQGLKGENAFFIAERFGAEMLSDYVAMVMKQPLSQACLAGWVDGMNEHHDVFLYLTEKQKEQTSLEHSASVLTDLYEY